MWLITYWTLLLRYLRRNWARQAKVSYRAAAQTRCCHTVNPHLWWEGDWSAILVAVSRLLGSMSTSQVLFLFRKSIWNIQEQSVEFLYIGFQCNTVGGLKSSTTEHCTCNKYSSTIFFSWGAENRAHKKFAKIWESARVGVRVTLRAAIATTTPGQLSQHFPHSLSLFP